MQGNGRTVAIFDLGGVLIDWNPRYLYRKLFPGDEAGMERFLSEICTPHWNERQDEGRRFAEAEAELIARHPDKAQLIRAWHARFPEMIPGAIEEVVDVLGELRARGTRLYALTNWSAETFPSQRRRFEFFDWFAGIVVSGQEGVIKPDPRIFHRLLSRFAVKADQSVFIDDNLKNAQAASALGIHGIHYRTPAELRRDLVNVGLL